MTRLIAAAVILVALTACDWQSYRDHRQAEIIGFQQKIIAEQQTIIRGLDTSCTWGGES